MNITIEPPMYSKKNEGVQTTYYALLSDQKFISVSIGSGSSLMTCSKPWQWDARNAAMNEQISREEFLGAVLAFTEKVEENFDELRQQITH